MIESELAFNKDGEPFAVPETVTGWRVRRLRGGRGAPELVYGPDGSPLTLDINAGMDELRDAVDTSGRYRLDAIDDDGKAVANVTPSYVHVAATPPNSSMPEPALPPHLNSTDHAIRELVRANCELVRTNSELAKSVATQQPDLMKAAAEILRAADGAGLPRREPAAEWDELDDDSDEVAPEAGFNWPSLMQEAVGVAKMWVVSRASGGVTTPGTGAPPRAASSAADDGAPESTTQQETSAPPSAPTVDPQAHMLEIQARLTPAEKAFVFGVLNKLSLADIMQWREQLAQMSVDDAVAMIRAEIEKRKDKAS